MERLRERRATQKDARLSLSLTHSLSFYPFFLPNSCAIVNNRASQGGGNAVIHLAPESAGNARERRATSWRKMLSLEELLHATRCDVHIIREIYELRNCYISLDNASFC